MMHNCYGRY